MADHHDHIEMDGPFAAGWLWAVVAAVIVAAVARWFDAPLNGALLLGLVTFVVYAVLLGQFWEAPVGEDHDHGHGHGGHHH
jgi:hypothetical protein